ncbi:MAG TPA: glutathione S-transferase family protein, partial [Beijerinckiaceae bacterium]|nr:glutathione S-transferase family protein [Beijerinckiaceae bacterium]
MTRVLYDLAGADPAVRFSPYCWRTKLALAHKGLSVETVPWRFSDKEALAFSGQGRVPVLVDGEKTVTDSWAIALYLDETYPDRPSLFGGAAVGATRFVNAWADTTLNGGISRLIVSDIAAIIDDKDKAYFHESRERRFGMPLEQVTAGRAERVTAFRETLLPLRQTLSAQAYLGGAEPTYADYIVLGSFQWARCCSRFELLEPGDPVAGWRERMLDRFDGLARNAA